MGNWGLIARLAATSMNDVVFLFFWFIHSFNHIMFGANV